jgi:ABC-2 type transport system ATP-binding protein
VVGLSDRKDDLVKRFSGGMKRRLEIARGLLHHPKILFLDEPTVGLDPQTRNHLWSYVTRLNAEEGITIFLTTHYMEEAERLCDRVAIMDHGKIIAQGTPRELIASIGVEHVVEFSTGSVALDLAGIRGMAGVRDVRSENGGVLLQVTELHQAVPALLEELGRQGVPLTELRTHSATLEDVFVHLTGRHLRDE